MSEHPRALSSNTDRGRWPMPESEWRVVRRSAPLWEVHRERDLCRSEADRFAEQLAGAVRALRKIASNQAPLSQDDMQIAGDGGR